MLPSPTKFRASYLKLERAKRHLDELQAEVRNYLATDPLSLIWERTPWTERYANLYPRDAELVGLVARVRNPVPETLAPIIGDVIHNLRSALDIMMCEVITDADPTVNIRHTNFPFWSDSGSKADALRRSNVQRAGNAVVVLLEAWEPFPGGRSRLHALNDLWNLDKHRSIVPIMTGVEYSQGYAACVHHLEGQRFVDPFPTRAKAFDGKLFMVFPQEHGPPIGTVVPCVCQLGLDASEIKGRTLLGELQSQTGIVSSVLTSFETGIAPEFCPAASRPPVQIANSAWIFPPGTAPDEVESWMKSRMRNP